MKANILYKKEIFKKIFDIAPSLNTLSSDTLEKIKLFLVTSNLDDEQQTELILLIAEISAENFSLGQYAG